MSLYCALVVCALSVVLGGNLMGSSSAAAKVRPEEHAWVDDAVGLPAGEIRSVGYASYETQVICWSEPNGAAGQHVFFNEATTYMDRYLEYLRQHCLFPFDHDCRQYVV